MEKIEEENEEEEEEEDVDHMQTTLLLKFQSISFLDNKPGVLDSPPKARMFHCKADNFYEDITCLVK
ncbi:Hypothetical predicted protein [Octopus vulgaris]|uniref:Uncharacterized protein n=1 Tax=Octopus vulgaris TaxID=6645 RepID=A0AA36BCX4_OCTVU|nr:Hypothetical predicted protein [Octopus vulgaris]